MTSSEKKLIFKKGDTVCSRYSSPGDWDYVVLEDVVHVGPAWSDMRVRNKENKECSVPVGDFRLVRRGDYQHPATPTVVAEKLYFLINWSGGRTQVCGGYETEEIAQSKAKEIFPVGTVFDIMKWNGKRLKVSATVEEVK